MVSKDSDSFFKLPRGLIISSQASLGEPLNDPEMLAAMAESGILGGAVAARLEGVESIRAFKRRRPDIPVIGLIKTTPPLAVALLDAVYITPSIHEVQLLIEAGADWIALDATHREHALPLSNAGRVALLLDDARCAILDSGRNIGLWADCASLRDGLSAIDLGFDVVSTTLSGYTRETVASAAEPEPGPDFHLLSALVQSVQANQHSTQVVLEGRVWEPWQVREAFDLGAHAVVVGSAITRPILMSRRFCNAALGEKIAR
ncbi:MAG: putative N-acetylmannosamine-6-phosphate 2-epimerase [Vampirovibrionales bacterium]|nr:putative N-acetylmannosamine-6-phosphate 2-epimerase [Vampirovibrionales bacterium]